MDLIEEAKKRGYRKGLAIRYVAHMIDHVEGDYFEMKEGNVVAYSKPKCERKSFDDERFDTLYDSYTKEWVEIVDDSNPKHITISLGKSGNGQSRTDSGLKYKKCCSDEN